MGQEALIDARLKAKIPKICISAIGMGVAIYAAQYALWDSFQITGIRYFALLVLVGVGAISYGGFMISLGGRFKNRIASVLAQKLNRFRTRIDPIPTAFTPVHHLFACRIKFILLKQSILTQ